MRRDKRCIGEHFRPELAAKLSVDKWLNQPRTYEFMQIEAAKPVTIVKID